MGTRKYVSVVGVLCVMMSVIIVRVHAVQEIAQTETPSSVSECMSGCGDPASDTYSSCLNSCLGITPGAKQSESVENIPEHTPVTTPTISTQQTQPVYSRFSGCRATCQSIPCYIGCLITGKSSNSDTGTPAIIVKKSFFEQIRDRIMFWKKPQILSGKACGIGTDNGNCKRCEDTKSYFDQITEAWYCGEKPATTQLFGIQPILPTITLPPLKIPTLALPTLRVPTLSVPRISPEASSSGE